MIDISSLENAIKQLEISLSYTESDLAEKDGGIALQFRAASIQAFEYTYELAHKMLKRYLEDTEPSPDLIESMTFQELIRTGAERGLLLNSWDIWKAYRKARGSTSHTYNEDSAVSVFSNIPQFLEEVRFLRDQINTRQQAK